MWQTYIVELRSGPIEDLNANVLKRFGEELLDDRRLLGPAPSADLALRVLEVRTAVEAEGPTGALNVALSSFARATKKVPLADVDVVDCSVWLDDDSEYDRRELLSGADIAERLGISRQRIAQLVAEKGRFPRPTATFGTVSVWQWGDVADWIAAGGRGDMNRLSAEAVLQVYSLVRDDMQRVAAILRMVDLANDGNGFASSFLEHLRRTVVSQDSETSRWVAGPLLRKYEGSLEEDKPTNLIELMDALKRSVERARQQEVAPRKAGHSGRKQSA
jgi:predicted DNA-binding transcriptional regulator AlpA